MDIQCFWLTPTEEVSVRLRRFVSHNGVGVVCSTSPHGYHDVEVIIEQAHKDAYGEVYGDRWDHNDPRWPQSCSCGYVFKENDQWQLRPCKLYQRADTGALVTMDEAPAGAMMNADWYQGWKNYKTGTDGVTLMVKIPPGDWWCVDGPSYINGQAGPGWTRTGVLLKVTAHPSILTSRYHGWLTDGVLKAC